MLNKKKISILTLSMGHGGAEKVISLLLPELIKEYDVYLYLFYPTIHYIIPSEVKVITSYSNHKNGLWRRMVSPLVIYRKYVQFLKKEQIKISISFLFRANIINGMVKNKNSDIKVLMSERNYPSKMYNTSWVRLWLSKLLIKKLYNKADVLFSNSYYINQDLKQNFDVTIPIKTLYNPIEKPIKTHNVQKVTNEKEAIKIVSVGRFEQVKNHSLLFKAIEQIRNATLTIIGEGTLRGNYRNEIERRNLSERVYLPGISKKVLNDLLDYHIFILSSDSEGFPNALLEAMSVGLPVISTNCLSGPLELLNEGQEIKIEKDTFYKAKYGLLTNVNDVEALVKAIQYYQNNIDVRRYYSQQSLMRSEFFFIESIYQDFKKIIAITQNET